MGPIWEIRGESTKTQHLSWVKKKNGENIVDVWQKLKGRLGNSRSKDRKLCGGGGNEAVERRRILTVILMRKPEMFNKSNFQMYCKKKK